MRYLRYVALLAAVMVPLAYSQAQVEAGVAVGNDPGPAAQGYDQGYDDPGPGYVNGPPVCPYGYYSYYPYACAPYGFYGPQWFLGGVFIGAGPWYHWGWGHGGYYGRVGYGHGYYGHGYYGRGFVGGRGYAPGYARGSYGHGNAGNYARGGYSHSYAGSGGFHGGGAVHGGGGFHSGGGSHGGGRR